MLTWRELPHLHQLASMLPGHSSSSYYFYFDSVISPQLLPCFLFLGSVGCGMPGDAEPIAAPVPMGLSQEKHSRNAGAWNSHPVGFLSEASLKARSSHCTSTFHSTSLPGDLQGTHQLSHLVDRSPPEPKRKLISRRTGCWRQLALRPPSRKGRRGMRMLARGRWLGLCSPGCLAEDTCPAEEYKLHNCFHCRLLFQSNQTNQTNQSNKPIKQTIKQAFDIHLFHRDPSM